jgi:hypothetical protein
VLCAVEDCDTDGSVLVGAVAAYAGLGAGIGVGIDALITHSHVVYQRPTPSSALRFVPILSDGRRGLAVSLSY